MEGLLGAMSRRRPSTYIMGIMKGNLQGDVPALKA
jgi:hypothetical protein